MSREAELMAEVGMAVSRLTQILTRDDTPTPPKRTHLVGEDEMALWLDTKAAQILTQKDIYYAVFMRGDIVSKYSCVSDLYALSPVEAIAIGQALIAAGRAASVGNVVPIGGNS